MLYSVFEGIYHGLVQGKGYPLSDIRDLCNNLLSTDKVDNRQLKVLLTAKYGNQIRFSGSDKKFALIYVDCVSSERMADTIAIKIASNKIPVVYPVMQDFQQKRFSFSVQLPLQLDILEYT